MDQEKLNETKILIKEIVQENFPEIDVREGTVAYDLLISLASIGASFISEEIDKFEITQSLRSILDNPDNVDDDVYDAILSNWFMVRREGTKVQGTLKITVNAYKPYYINADTSFFTRNNFEFKNNQALSLDKEDLISTPDGNYYFLLEVEAVDVGTEFSIEEDTAFTSIIFPLNLLSISALANFSTGLNRESSQELLDRAKTVISTRDLVSKRSIVTILNEAFPEVEQITAIGYNDREMQRDINNIGVKIGGKVDILFRTKNVLTKTIEVNTDSNRKSTIKDNNIPILRIKSYALKNSPLNKIYDFNISVSSSTYKLQPKFARYTIYEEITIETKYSDNTIILDIDYLPYVKEIQAYIDSPDIKNICVDNLVKTYMPCFLTFNIDYKPNEDIADENLIKTLIVTFINSYTHNTFYISKLIDAIADIDSIKYITLPLEVIGKYYLPDGTITEIKSYNKIEIDPDYDIGFSNKTFKFFCSISDITLKEIEE